jgi:DGQHR domain-containing protein
MLTNVFSRDDLRSLARRKRQSFESKSVPLRLLDEELAAGWTLGKKSRRSARVTKPKLPGVLLEDRVWTIFYAMGFQQLSGQGGAALATNANVTPPLTNQLDVLAMDDEVCLAIECKSSAVAAKRPQLQNELTKLAALREPLSRAVNTVLRADSKRIVVLALFTYNAILSDTDRNRADDLHIVLLDNDDLAYYQSLTTHLGPAARYQFLSDLLPGRRVPGLEVRVPAVRSKMAGYYCYTFSISPEYLLKIAYVSHRAKGKATDIDTYQRMVSKSRLKKIFRYISDDGIFPTNIVVNINKGKRGKGLQFEQIKQEEQSEFGSVGWLTIAPTYKAAWIIDGQHRLFAYSGHPRAATSIISVLAFEGLPASHQAQLFIDINAEQKKVKQSLLQQLYSELHWDSDDPIVQTGAIVSKAIQTLGLQRDSPFYDRILLADAVRSQTRCISLTSVFAALEKTGFFYYKVTSDGVVDPAPLWTGNSLRTLKRTNTVVKAWFDLIQEAASDWWELGAGEGGGLAMNDGVTVCLTVLKSVFEHLESGSSRLMHLGDQEIVDRIRPFGMTLGRYLADFTPDERRGFRGLRGVQGQTTGMRQAQNALHKKHPDFDPPGLEEFLERERSRTSERAEAAVKRIERSLQTVIVSELKENFNGRSDEWWYEGVPASVRTKAMARMEEDKDARGGRDKYLDLIDYKTIALANWSLFKPLLAYGKSGTKADQTHWIVAVNDVRRKVVHASSGAWVTQEQLNALEEYEVWLTAQIESGGNAETIAEGGQVVDEAGMSTEEAEGV